MKEFFDQIKSITDILNVGRLIFYPFAGALTVVPFYMLVHLFLSDPCEQLSAQMLSDLRSIIHAQQTSLAWVCFFFAPSLVVGFLIATMGFFIVVKRLFDARSSQIERDSPNMSSFAYNYPLLRQKKDEDYATWLISEFYRYVEIATYIPLGGFIGLILIEVYMFVFLLRPCARPTSAGLTTAHTSFLVILGMLIIVKYYIWPEVWVKRVLRPLVQSASEAQRDLIDGVKKIDKAVKLIS